MFAHTTIKELIAEIAKEQNLPEDFCSPCAEDLQSLKLLYTMGQCHEEEFKKKARATIEQHAKEYTAKN
jgi:hypothetical protein